MTVRDVHRENAEEYLGHKIPDSHWTPEARRLWKAFFFSKMYSAEGTFLHHQMELDKKETVE